MILAAWLGMCVCFLLGYIVGRGFRSAAGG